MQNRVHFSELNKSRTTEHVRFMPLIVKSNIQRTFSRPYGTTEWLVIHHFNYKMSMYLLVNNSSVAKSR